jgi:hypothetical protein
MKLDFDKLAGAVVDTIRKALDHQIPPIEQRVQVLETKPVLKLCGTFETGKTYVAGDACIHRRALWICKATTTDPPGEDFVGQQLALKRGDAR